MNRLGVGARCSQLRSACPFRGSALNEWMVTYQVLVWLVAVLLSVSGWI
ncbi:hypothetical protein LMG29739_06223 [Paraburkholderia solisilvae]|uniref:Uncharacterized protein n=1 Tax=Paraburkholderia solisilvae TaxID=624376 RepID=A0A6J5F056_9BURK|nr:hypothetical protein LMG29739_06223 [Paraburkholderia solisilvae]